MDMKQLKLKAKELKSSLSIIYLAFLHPQTPWYAKAVIFLVLAYALSPIDLIPDFIPVLGYLDDLILIPVGITLAIKLIPRDIYQACQTQQNDPTKTSPMKQKGIWGAVFILAIWFFILYALGVLLLQ
ncbi:YkvA family protein [Rubeoparvulum massiliense]|uniref:YkvA family protein n=1 Tax=Rubeoparvulum massiliense TaxID=1631346 RepID=UPI00065E42F3|nr:YkvA family protein [Rubeoparvulum massiliense]